MTKNFDYLNRLSLIDSMPGGTLTTSSRMSFGYLYNQANQRTRVTLSDNSYWTYDYDKLGQLKGGKRYWSDFTVVRGQQYEYTFDDIGNRTNAKMLGAIGTEYPQDLWSAKYTVNIVNQITARDVPGLVEVRGIANAAAYVSIYAGGSGGGGSVRKGEYFFNSQIFNNADWTSRYPSVSVTAQNGSNSSNVVGNAYLAFTPEQMNYDLDGNLYYDGRWYSTWDGENRLTRIESLSSGPSGSQRRVDSEYDCQGRRIRRKVYTGGPWTWTLSTDTKYLYDGWNVIAELDGSNNLLRSYIWEQDLSGSMQGAGGVGGLVGVKPAGGVVHFAAYDGNGNVAGLVDGSGGSVSANYEYGPFGEPIRVSGTMGKANPFRWSAKFTDDETDLVYYGYRYYNPSTGRFLNRDPIEEKGGLNLYAFTRNDPVNAFDPFGLATIKLIIGADTSADLDEKEVQKFALTFKEKLKTILKYCQNKCKVGGNIEVEAIIGTLDISAPARNDYTIELMKPAVEKVSSDPGVKVLLTRSSLVGLAVGRGLAGTGQILNTKTMGPNTFLHEMGHVAGYLEGDIDDGVHHSRKANIMHKQSQLAALPDKFYCERLAELAK